MGTMRERLPGLLEDRLELTPITEAKVKDRSKDKDGWCSVSLTYDLIFIGMAEFILNQDVVAFKKNFSEAAQIGCNIIKRYDAGEPIASSFVSVLAGRYVFYALVSGDIELAKTTARLLDGSPEIKKIKDSKFSKALGLALKALVLESPDVKKRIDDFVVVMDKDKDKRFAGYADALIAIYDKDDKAFDLAIEKIIIGHRALSKGRSMYSDTDDELMCIWGLGLVNLAKHRGMKVTYTDILIPSELSDVK